MRSSFADKQEDVVRLRKAGKTYGEIREILKCHIPKSTLSYWCRNVALPETGLNRIEKLVQEGGEKGRALALSRRRVMRAEYLGSLYSQNKSLRNHLFQDKQTAKIALAVLYLAEGGKTQRGSLMFGNSDPNIISLFLTLLQKVYDTEPSKFRCTLLCRADHDTKKLERDWSNITGIPLSQFYKARIDARTIGKKSRKPEYKGVCRIEYYSAHVYHDIMSVNAILTT